MTKWRLLDTGQLPAAENMALDEVLLEAKAQGKSPNTIRYLQFLPPAVLVGYHQSLEQEVRVDYCQRVGIDINRRITGGGAIFFDESQLGWEIICEKNFFNLGIANPDFFKKLCQPTIYALKKLGINASFRARNDIEVDGRKISGTGGTEEGGAFLFQGTLLVDFDIDSMLRALRIPIEKLKDKEIEIARERVTCLRWELGKAVDLAKLKQALKEGFERIFGIELIEDGLNEYEELLLKQKIEQFRSQEWINKIRLPRDEQRIVYSHYKAKGGLIRTSLMINLRYKRLQSMIITGDFFAYPKRAIFDLEADLKDILAERKLIEEKIIQFFHRNKCEIPGVTPKDFVNAIDKALKKVGITEFGIPLKLANRIFTVKGSFNDVVKTSPRHLLLPYCSKSTECGYRYKQDCIECGECSIGEAYTLARERDMWVTTIVSFEHLMETLKKLQSNGVSSYIGCCCEAFYKKHLEDFEESGVPGILIDIDNQTCYELGKAKEAYLGNFENQTELNLDLLKRVLDVVL